MHPSAESSKVIIYFWEKKLAKHSLERASLNIKDDCTLTFLHYVKDKIFLSVVLEKAVDYEINNTYRLIVCQINLS